MGVFQMGDPVVELEGRVVSENGGLSQHVFDCPSTCSSNSLQQPVTVFREHLHMHRTGASMINTHFRNGEVLREGAVEYWDFEQQGNLAVVQQPFELQPGDAFRTTCNYDASDGVVFGLGSQDEMCVGFFYYFIICTILVHYYMYIVIYIVVKNLNQTTNTQINQQPCTHTHTPIVHQITIHCSLYYPKRR